MLKNLKKVVSFVLTAAIVFSSALFPKFNSGGYNFLSSTVYAAQLTPVEIDEITFEANNDSSGYSVKAKTKNAEYFFETDDEEKNMDLVHGAEVIFSTAAKINTLYRKFCRQKSISKKII